MQEQPISAQPTYTVMVDSNTHYMDPEGRYTVGTFATCPEAVDECRRIVDLSLAELCRPGMAAEELMDHYTQFGDDPFIVSPDNRCLFHAWTYARERCVEMCSAN